jgi:hypothetical protein
MDRNLQDALDEEESKEFEPPWCLGRWGTSHQRMVEQRGTNDWWRRGRMGAELPSTALWHGRGRNSQLTYLYVLAPPLEPSAILTQPEPSATLPLLEESKEQVGSLSRLKDSRVLIISGV